MIKRTTIFSLIFSFLIGTGLFVIKNKVQELEDELKQDFFTHVISEIGKPMSKVDEKIIKNLCKETYIKDENN